MPSPLIDLAMSLHPVCRRICMLLAAALLLGSGKQPAHAQEAVRHIDIDTREGTWVSVDVSPDGSHLVFDLLGDLYLLPSTGGEARRLTPLPKRPAANNVAAQPTIDRPAGALGQAFDAQPRFSPDGRHVVFISDRDGADNVYVLNMADGSLRQISFGRDMHTSPTWSPDGVWIAVRRVTARPNAFVGTAGELMLYPVAGGEARQLTRSADVGDVSGLEFSRDGMYLYAAVPNDPVRNEIPHGRTFQIKRFDLRSRAHLGVTDNFGGAVRPRITPDGRFLTYATFDDGEMVLRIRELASNRELIVKRGIEHAAVLAGTQLDVLPGYGFSPDGRFVFLSYGGRIQRVSVADGSAVDVPFHVRTTLQVGPANYFKQRPLDGRMPVRMLNWAHFTPGGERAVFEAVGKIWVVDRKGGAPQRLTRSDAREYAPSISSDGRWVAYVTWSDSLRGHLHKVPLAGGSSIQLTHEPGYYANPNWSGDDKTIVVIVGDNADLRGLEPTQDMRRHLAVIPAGGGALQRVISTLDSGGRFGGFQDIGGQFNRDGTRIWFVTGDGAELRSVGIDDGEERTHLRIANPQYQVATYITVSPDEKQVAFTAGNHEVWVLPMPDAAVAPLTVNPRAPASTGLTRVSTPAGYAPRWLNDRELSWTFADRIYRAPVGRTEAPRVTQVDLNVEIPAARGIVALKNARLITMDVHEVIERGTIIMRDNRIVAIGATQDVTIPAGAAVLDLAGKTVIPGLLDIHDHGFGGSAVRNWPERHIKATTKLAYGVTLSRDVSAPVQAAFSLTELLNSGAILGPRAYAAGQPILPAIVEVRTRADALNVVQMMKDLGAIVLKQYQQPTRQQRQLVAEAALQTKLMITGEGGRDYKTNLTLLLDGYTASEHLWAPFPLYGDVGQLMAQTGYFYTPTTGTSAAGSEHWYRRMEVDTDPKQQRFVPHAARESLARRVRLAKIAPEWEPVFYAVVQSANRLRTHGAKIATGSHDVPTPSGLGLHWEIWSYVEGGMAPLEALRAATITSAEALGMDEELGSLAVGKLADLAVLTANPLSDIRNTLAIELVMRNGLLYDGITLEPVTTLIRR